MNGIHDMGGMHGFGAIEPDPEEPLFHAPWERDVLALTIAMGARGVWNLDESRFTRESIPPVDYLSIGYYRIWLTALEQLLIKHQLVTASELANGEVDKDAQELAATLPKPLLSADKVAAALAMGSPANRVPVAAASFTVGESVLVVNCNPAAHTRLPRYVRGKRGVVHAIHGCHVLPDSNASGAGEQPTWLYNIKFSAKELWGGESSGFVHVDCWEPYLQSPGRLQSTSAAGTTAEGDVNGQ